MIGPGSRCLLAAAAMLALFVGHKAQALTIDPTFDSTITSDPNAAAIENVINGAIDVYEQDFSDPITVKIYFEEMSTGLSDNVPSFDIVSYSTYITALRTDAKTANDSTALKQLPIASTNPVTGGSDIELMTADEKAVGLTPSAQTYDGTILLNTHVTDVGSPGSTKQYSLMEATEHEIDEVLGLQSALAFSTTTPMAWDLFRYQCGSTDVRSYTKSTTAQACFSIDGTTDLDTFNNSGTGDYGDWATGSDPQVQDAFATAGADPALNVELIGLDVIGYDYVPGIPTVPEPASMGLLASGLAALGWLRRRRSVSPA